MYIIKRIGIVSLFFGIIKVSFCLVSNGTKDFIELAKDSTAKLSAAHGSIHFETGKNKVHNCMFIGSKSGDSLAIVSFDEDNNFEGAQVKHPLDEKIKIIKVLDRFKILISGKDYCLAILWINRSIDFPGYQVKSSSSELKQGEQLLIAGTDGKESNLVGFSSIWKTKSKKGDGLFTAGFDPKILVPLLRLETSEEKNRHHAIASALYKLDENGYVLYGIGVKGLNKMTGESLYIKASALFHKIGSGFNVIDTLNGLKELNKKYKMNLCMYNKK